MTTANPVMLFRDALVVPSAELIQLTMGEPLYLVYCDLIKLISIDLGLSYEWKYYNDGKAWLFKAMHKKKTVCWLSAWNSHFKVSVYFNEKTAAGVQQLQIKDATKAKFSGNIPIGKFMPLTMEIDDKEQLIELREIMTYRKNLK